MVFSLCEWGQNKPWEWGRQVGGQLWRTTGDISDRWNSMLGILDKQVGLEKYSGPGGWNDPDMLEVGNGRMSYDEYVAHFSLWALLNAPLIAGNDLRSMSDSTRGILINKDVIARRSGLGRYAGHPHPQGQRDRGLGQADARRLEGAWSSSIAASSLPRSA